MSEGIKIMAKVKEARGQYQSGKLSYEQLVAVAKEACKQFEQLQIQKFGKVRQKFSPHGLIR